MNTILGPGSPLFILEPNVQWRNTYQIAAREVGFTAVETAGSFEEILEKISVRGDGLVSTVLTALCDSVEADFLQNLVLSAKGSKFKDCRHLVIYSQRSENFLPFLFENGVLASLKSPCSQENLRIWLENYKRRVLEMGEPEELFASEFLSECLVQSESLRDFDRLQRQLLRRFPGNLDVALRVAEVESRAGQTEKARQILQQAEVLNPSEQEKIVQKAARLDLGPLHFNTDLPFDCFGLKLIYIVDNDPDLLSAVEHVFQKKNVQVRTFQDPFLAFSALEAGESPDAILFDWRLPKKGGTRFVQRVIASGIRKPTLIALSGFLRPQDGRLLHELGVVEIMPKPFAPEDLVDTLLRVLQREGGDSDPKTVVRQLREKIHILEFKAAWEKVEAALEQKLIGLSSAEILRAEIELKDGKNAECVKRITKAIAQTSADVDQRVVALHLLGCALLKLKQPTQALKVLEKIDELSPENLERMCLIAECHAENNDWKRCSETLSQAIEFDSQNETVVRTTVQLVERPGSKLVADDVYSAFGKDSAYVGQMNNIAVARARSGQAEQARSMLEKLLALCGNAHTHSSSVFFNLLVVLCRQGLREEAKKRFESQNSEFAGATDMSKLNWMKLQKHLGIKYEDSPQIEDLSKEKNEKSVVQSDLSSLFTEVALGKQPALRQRGLRGIFLSSQEAPLEIQMILKAKKP